MTAATAPSLRLLAIETSTEHLSLALADGGRVWQHSGPGGAQASATLLPALLALLAQAGLRVAQLDAIAFGRGPGSFTGLRTACAVAQGLGFGAGVKLLPVDTLLALAEDARARHGVHRVVAVLDARMDEVYVAAHDLHAYAAQRPWGAQLAAPRLARPQDVAVPPGWALAGNAFDAYGARLPAVPQLPALPSASALLRLAPALLAAGHAVAAQDAWPAYIRDKVAQTSAERAAAKAAAAAPT